MNAISCNHNRISRFFTFHRFILMLTGMSIAMTGAQNHPDSDNQAGADKILTPGSASAMTFRGNRSLSGRAHAGVLDSLNLKWTFRTGGAVRSTAIIDKHAVYIGSGDGFLYALSIIDGSLLWKFKTGGAVEASPCMFDNRLFIGATNGTFYAVDGQEGIRLWSFRTADKILGSANIVNLADKGRTGVVFGSYDGKLYCLDTATGDLLWAYATSYYLNGTPAVSEDRVVIGGCDAIIHVVDARTGAKVHEINAGSYIAASVAVDGKEGYVGHYGSEFICVNIASATIDWRYKESQFPYFSSAAVAADRVVVGCRDKRVHCIGRSSGQRLWTFPAQARVDASPVIVGESVIVGADSGRLYQLSLETGEEQWQYDIGEPISSGAAIAENHLVIGTENGNIYVFEGR